MASPLSVEVPAELLLELGWAETSGILYGYRRGREVRVTAIAEPRGEEQEKVGVFFSRIRGEVFLTEADLAFFHQHSAELALVVAGKQAGFFVREANGSIQTVRSHEEFSIATPPSPALPGPVPSDDRQAYKQAWRAALANLLFNGPATRVALRPLLFVAVLSVAAVSAMAFGALAMFPQHPAQSSAQTPAGIRIQEIDHQLRISWSPAGSAVLTIRDDGNTVSVPVLEDQSTATYAMQGTDVEVTLLSVDPGHRLHRSSARFVSAKALQ